MSREDRLFVLLPDCRQVSSKTNQATIEYQYVWPEVFNFLQIPERVSVIVARCDQNAV
jgi:hypothetical protein